MNIHELVDMFYHKLNGPDDATAEDAMRVVVRALRDELKDMPYLQRYMFFEEILGDAGAAKVAGVPAGNEGRAADSTAVGQYPVSPATDPIRDAVAMARGRALVVDDIPMLNKMAAMMKPAADPSPRRSGYTEYMNETLPMKVADAAPAVCVWVKGQKGGVRPSCSDLYEYAPYVAREGVCPECKAPIKFTEANHG